MKLKFKGILDFGNYCRVAGDGENNGSIFIGGKDVISEIAKAGFLGKITVGIADKRFNGDLEVDLGWGYSEWTPIESDRLKVGSHNLIEILERYSGEEITMWVSDEPINLLE